MINIENFEDKGEINSPRSVEALRQCGLVAKDLVQKDR